MQAPKLTPPQADALVDELAAALEEMVARSCADMAPLWLDATRSARALIGDDAVPELGFVPSPRFMALSKGARSRYRALAAWRHAVLWQRAHVSVADAEFHDAMEVVYFTAYPDNAPPYSWSQSAAKAPGVERFESPTTLKNHAKEGCWHSVDALLRRKAALLARQDWESELRSRLLRPATRRSLRELLKLESHPHWER